MDATSTALERERAFDSFCRIVEVHMATLQVLTLVSAMPDSESFLEAQIKLRQGMRVDPSGHVGELAVEYLTTVRVERDRSFETLRRLTLVSICGALEYLIKAVLVDQAASNIEQATELLAKSNVKLQASDVLGLSQQEQWFQVADQLFKKPGEGGSSMYQRSVSFLKFAHMPQGTDQTERLRSALTSDEVRMFDEAFLVRNCLVHNGGRVSSPLARHNGMKRGSLIDLNHKYGKSLILPVREFARAINSLWHGSL